MLQYEKISDTTIRRMLRNAHNPKKAFVRTAFLKQEYAFFRKHIRDKKVLVAGSGLGHDAFKLAKHNRQVIGIEIIPLLVNEAIIEAHRLKFNNVTFIAGDFLKANNLGHFDAAVLNMGTIGNFDDIAAVIKKLLKQADTVYFDFYVTGRENLLKRKKMYEEEAWCDMHIKGNKIYNAEGFESLSYSRRYIKEMIEKAGGEAVFYKIDTFAYMTEVRNLD